MNSFIISSRNKEEGVRAAVKILKNEKIDDLDISFYEFEKAMGIEDVRNIKPKIYLKPFKSLKKATVLVIPYGATIEAQNSMLKLLEEPPQNTIIILISKNAQELLPTIISRCKVIELRQEIILDDEEMEDMLKKLIGLVGIGERLYLAQSLSKDRDEAIVYLEKMILHTRRKMIETLSKKQPSKKYKDLIDALNTAYFDLKNTNINARLALENLFLNI